jgi:hypothetical protein
MGEINENTRYFVSVRFIMPTLNNYTIFVLRLMTSLRIVFLRMLKNSKIFFSLILGLIIFVNEVMEKKQIKAKYIVVKQPDDNIAYRNVIKFLYIVITREELSKKIDNYLNGKIESTAGVYAPLDLFNHIIKHRKVYSYEEAKRRARYLNKKYGRK